MNLNEPPIEVSSEELVDKIHDILVKDRRIKLPEIAEMIRISYERVRNIHEVLKMEKLSARWVPWLLTPDQKRTREDVSKSYLEKL